MTDLKRTPLYPLYKDHAKLVPFGGWELPVQFTSIMEEHHAVRNDAGIFDVSHMGEIVVKGKGATDFLQRLVTNDVSRVDVNQAQYTPMCYPDGGIVDDFLLYKRADDDYLLVVNAANTEKDVDWLLEFQTADVSIENISEQIGQIALQGPKAEKILQKLTAIDLSAIRFFRFLDDVDVAGVNALVSRSGYTGEDGFELYVSRDDVGTLWEKLLEAGNEEGLLPCGLGARDSLRFEACLPLYGQELSASISPLEARLGFAVKLDKPDFIGREALVTQKECGVPRKLIGIEMLGRGIPRTGYPVYVGDEEVGEVTSGTKSPTLGKSLGMALVKSDYTELEQPLDVEIRGKRIEAKVTRMPFYKRTN